MPIVGAHINRRTGLAMLVTAAVSLVPGAAAGQARTPGPAGHVAGIAAPAPKGAKTYHLHCVGCGAAEKVMYVYPKTKRFEIQDNPDFGPFVKHKRGVTEFIYEQTNECVIVMKKNRTGYSSEAEPGTFGCEGKVTQQIWATKG